MSNPGWDFEELVSLVESVIDPGGQVNTRERVPGPDGKREVDVSIRGSRDGEPFFAFIECKDYGTRKIGIGAVDALDSKRRDLNADMVCLYTNSGFTAQALRKANRVGISTFAALADGDNRTRARAMTLALGRLIKIINLEERIVEPPGQDFPMPRDLEAHEILFEGKPVHNWVADELDLLLADGDLGLTEPALLTIVYEFSQQIAFEVRGAECRVLGMHVVVNIGIDWFQKPVAMTAELARFDFQTGLLRVPPETPLEFDLPLDFIGWELIDEPPQREGGNPQLPFFQLIAKLASSVDRSPGGSPDLSRHLAGADVYVDRLTIAPLS